MEKDETVVVTRTEQQKLADEALQVALKQFDTATLFQKPVFDRIMKNEDMLSGKSVPALKGRNNVPMDTVILNGFLDALLSGQDEPISIKFKNTREQDLKASKKISAVWDREKSPAKGNFDAYILDVKYFAAVSGRGFLKFWVDSMPKFGAHMYVCDHFDMLTEPMGGPYLDPHLFKGEQNIFRTTTEVEELATSGHYDADQVRALKSRYQEEDFKKNVDSYKFKMMRYAAMGLDIDSNDYVGEKLYNFTEWVMFFKGKWRYMVFDYRAKTWVRFKDLEDVFAHAEEYPGRGPWVSFSTNRHPKLFWNKAILDDIRPVAYTMKKVLNLSLDNLEKRNWDMKAYDPNVFKDPTQLLYKQDGLAKATLDRGKSIQSGIFQFQTPDTTAITINLNQYLDRFLSTKSGITEAVQGAGAADTTNGIYFGNIQQSQNRLGLKNKMFYQAMFDIGTMFDWGCYEHLSEKYAVKILGPNGVQWEEEVTKLDLEKEFMLEVTGGNDEERANAAMLTRKAAVLAEIGNSQTLSPRLNASWLLREKLAAGGYDDEQVRRALDTQNDGNEDILSEAAEAIYEIVEGGDPMLNRGAMPAYVQKIMDFAQDKYPLCTPQQLAKMTPDEKKKYNEDTLTFQKLVNFAQAHIEIASQNAMRKALAIRATNGQDPTAMNAEGANSRATDMSTLLPADNGTGGPTLPVTMGAS